MKSMAGKGVNDRMKMVRELQQGGMLDPGGVILGEADLVDELVAHHADVDGRRASLECRLGRAGDERAVEAGHGKSTLAEPAEPAAAGGSDNSAPYCGA